MTPVARQRQSGPGPSVGAPAGDRHRRLATLSGRGLTARCARSHESNATWRTCSRSWRHWTAHRRRVRAPVGSPGPRCRNGRRWPLPVRVPTKGLVLKEQGKTSESMRTVALPPWLVSRLLQRQVNAVPNEWEWCSAPRWGSSGTRRTPPSTYGNCWTKRALPRLWGTPSARPWRLGWTRTGHDAARGCQPARTQAGQQTIDRYMCRNTVRARAARIP